MNNKLLIITNESISMENNKFSCDNIVNPTTQPSFTPHPSFTTQPSFTPIVTSLPLFS